MSARIFRHNSQKRGVVLLVVLSLLALFAVLVVTFVIVASQYRQAATAVANVKSHEDVPSRLLDRAMYTLVRDTTDARSPMRGHSLLHDMYGPGFTVTVSGPANSIQAVPALPANRAHFVEFPVVGSGLHAMAGYYNGCVLTPLTGGARGISMRIVGYSGSTNTTSASFRVLRPRGDVNTIPGLAVGNVLRINGRAFGGEGFGFHANEPASSPVLPKQQPWLPPATYSAGGLDQPDKGPDNAWGKVGVDDDGAGGVDDAGEWLYPGSDDGWSCLLPNRVYQGSADPRLEDYARGGGNEEYDAVDFQNMALAAVMYDSSNTVAPVFIDPSFHRSALVDFWFKYMSATWLTPANIPLEDHLDVLLRPFTTTVNITQPLRSQIANFKRMFIMRVLPDSNAGFDGSNPSFTDAELLNAADDFRLAVQGGATDPWVFNPYRSGPWDVDTDGDGTADSVWIDPDFPSRPDRYGRLVRPLIAIHCVDLDGRLNVNAQGGDGLYSSTSRQYTLPSRLANSTASFRSAAGLPQGAGLGPADIDISSVTGTNTSRLLFGFGITPGRYGSNANAGANGLDALAARRFTDYPENYFSGTLSSFQSPPDLFGELRVGLDFRGQPDYSMANTANLLRTNSPYETDMSSDGPRGIRNNLATDQLFSLEELEAVLRSHDADTQVMQSRLRSLVAAFSTDSLAEVNRHVVTTDSYDLPVPNVVRPADLLEDPRPRNVMEIFLERVRVASALGTTVPSRAQLSLSLHLNALVASELLLGERMNINRPFGDGLDSNGNNVVDEHWQGALASQSEANDLSGNPDPDDGRSTLGFPSDLDNDGTPINTDTDEYLVRQIHARHLYMLLMALKPPAFNFDPTLPAADQPANNARVLAQWAINAVDFRDADAIMTPFEYDITPFVIDKGPQGLWGAPQVDDDGVNGTDDVGEALYPGSDDQLWTVDGILGTTDDTSVRRGLVWGAERPELLITETLAFHDRRIEDLDTDPSMFKYHQSPDMMDDDDFDQRLRPRGAFYLELYNPWSALAERKPAEFYYNDVTTTWQNGVILNKRAPDAAGTAGAGAPVWRIAITDAEIDPDHPTTPPTYTRMIYFTDASSLPPQIGAEKIFPPPLPLPIAPAIPRAPVLPGRYAVVGTYREPPTDLADPEGEANNTSEYYTTIGRTTAAMEGVDLQKATTRRIVMHVDATNADANWVYVQDNGSVALPSRKLLSPPNDYEADIMPPVAVPIENLEVSEPLTGYPANDPDGVAFVGLAAGGEGAYTKPYDAPFDLTGPKSPEFGVVDQTVDDYCTAHVQRLANPLVAYDPILNPYRTIDSMSVPLTFFNGVTADTIDSPSDTYAFHSRERGDGTTSRLLWPHQPIGPALAITPAGGVAGHHFDRELNHSLGFLNEAYSPRFIWHYNPSGTSNSTAPSEEFLGAANYIAASSSPFPWLTWLNRPYVSPYEMLYVPKERSSQLLAAYSDIGTTTTYNPDPTATAPSDRFEHLLNFYATTHRAAPTWSSPFTVPTPVMGPNLYQLFDFLHAPSRFVGTETWLNPQVFSTSAPPLIYGTENLHPPFNRISHFRDPGKVNINTALDDRVWTGIQGVGRGAPSHPDYTDMWDSRRGFPSSGTGTTRVDFGAAMPTFVANPWRASDAGNLVPLTHQSLLHLKKVASPTITQAFIDDIVMERNNVECTLLRTERVLAETTLPTTPAPAAPLFEGSMPVTEYHRDSTRNPYFRYESLSRLPNLVTTRSNVYAVWITLGFFEVDATTGVVGQEVGADTGEIKRHRAFYIIDRSIPVAYEPGENHNVDRAILLRRFIE